MSQICNYGIGGHYHPHYDISLDLPNTENTTSNPDDATPGDTADDTDDTTMPERLGKRIATLLLYLGQTDAGGATVFTDAGARVEPLKVSGTSFQADF